MMNVPKEISIGDYVAPIYFTCEEELLFIAQITAFIDDACLLKCIKNKANITFTDLKQGSDIISLNGALSKHCLVLQGMSFKLKKYLISTDEYSVKNWSKDSAAYFRIVSRHKLGFFFYEELKFLIEHYKSSDTNLTYSKW